MLAALLRRFGRASPESIEANCARRAIPVDVARLSELVARRRAVVSALGALNAARNATGSSNPEALAIKTQRASLREELRSVESRLLPILQAIPNDAAPDTPDENTVIETIEGTTAEDRAFDRREPFYESAAETSGSQFLYLTGRGALLELTLLDHAVRKALKRGYELVKPPDVVRESLVTGAGFQPRNGSSPDVYRIQGGAGSTESGGGMCLAATAELPMLGYVANRDWKESKRFVAWSHCFRPECGRQPSQGLYRVHQFTKVELFAVCLPQESAAVLDEFVAFQRELFSELGFPMRLLRMAPNELGAPAAVKYDWEAWFPQRQAWGELTSASNCTDYQSLRLGVTAGSHGWAHIVNATAIAVPRVLQLMWERGAVPAALQR